MAVTLEAISGLLQPVRDEVQSLREDVHSLREDMKKKFQDVRSLIGEVHETATRGDLRILYGQPFAEPVHVRCAFALVELVTPRGLLLPSERGLRFVEKQLGTANPDFLQEDRAFRMLTKIYVSFAWGRYLAF